MNDKNIRHETDRGSTVTPYALERNTQLVFFDGQVPDEETVLKRGIRKQTLAALERVRAVAAEAGIGVQDLMRTTVYLTATDQSVAVEQAYDEFFDVQRPSRTLVGVKSLPNDAAVQIEATGVDR
jgi:2-iminobutanoate/2-iminopropanoate deaminase